MTPLNRRSLFTLVAFAVAMAILGLVVSCGYAPHKDPQLYTYETARVAEESARLHARDIGGTYHQNLCCGSMEPLIHAGDFIVVAPITLFPFSDDLLGRPCVYQPKWLPAEQLALHRFVSGNAKDGFIASGDGVKPDIDPHTGRDLHSENAYRIKAADYRGRVVGIYRVAAGKEVR